MSLTDRDADPRPPSSPDDGPGPATDPLPILALLRAELPTLPPQLQQLARFALDSPAEVGRLTITEFAARAGSSAASVTRLCRVLGVSGFSRLRMDLALAAQRSDQAPASLISGDITAQTLLPDLVTRLSALGARSMEETARLLDEDSFATVTQALGAANHVFVIGAGSTHMIAVSLEHKLRSLAVPSTAFHDPPSAVVGLAAARPGDVLVVVSATGTASETLPPLTEAARRGCLTVLITRVPRSDAAEYADHVFLAVQDSTPLRTGSLISGISEMFLADCLAGGVVVQHHARSLEALSSVEEALDRYW